MGCPSPGPWGNDLGLLQGHTWPGQQPKANLAQGTGLGLQLPELHAQLLA